MPRKKDVNQRIRDERRESILQVSGRMIAEKGIADIKISEIAEAANMSQGLLYRYYASKEELFTALVEERAESLIKPLREVLNSSTDSASQKLFNITEKMLEDIVLNSDRHQLLWQALALPNNTNKIMTTMGAYLQGNLRNLVAEGQREGEIRDGNPDMLVVLYLSAMQGLASSIHLFGQPILDHFPDTNSVYQILKS